MTDPMDWAERQEDELLDAALRLAPRLGWSARTVHEAGREVGLTGPETELLLPEGARDLAALLSRRLDHDALASLAAVEPTSLKIRERIRTAVLGWLDAALAHEPAVRRWTGFLALPPNAPLGLRLAWASADGLWRWAGDTATDENHYSKRALLSEILITTLAIAMASGRGAAERHLDGRIAGVMAFERWKARAFPPGEFADSAAAFLGRLRYGRRAVDPAADPAVEPAAEAAP
jgi:ubiquinone biosynthesis protein COQ9